MNELFYIPESTDCGVYEIINLRTRQKYVGSTMNIKERATVHAREIRAQKHMNVGLTEDAKRGDDFSFKVVFNCLKDNYHETRLRIRVVEYETILKYRANGENLYNREKSRMLEAALERCKRQLQKVNNRKDEIQKILFFSDRDLLKEFSKREYNSHEINIIKAEILRRMSQSKEIPECK